MRQRSPPQLIIILPIRMERKFLSTMIISITMPQTGKRRKSRLKGIIEVIEPAGSDKPRPANCEENRPVSAPIIPAGVYDPSPVDVNALKCS